MPPRPEFEDGIPDDVIGLRLLRQGHHHSTRPDDSHFFPRNLPDRSAQKFLVVERNICDDAHSWLNDVGRIQAPTHPDFEHRDSNFPSAEILERDRIPRICRYS